MPLFCSASLAVASVRLLLLYRDVDSAGIPMLTSPQSTSSLAPSSSVTLSGRKLPAPSLASSASPTPFSSSSPPSSPLPTCAKRMPGGAPSRYKPWMSIPYVYWGRIQFRTLGSFLGEGRRRSCEDPTKVGFV